MKFNTSELIRAQDRQLATVGITRHKNAGWLKKAMAREFTTQEVEIFRSARIGKKLPAGISLDETHNFGRPRLEKSGVGTRIISERFIAGEGVADLAEDYGVPMSEIENAMRFELKLKKELSHFELIAHGAELLGEDSRPMTAEESKAAGAALMAEFKSPEDFANELFRETGGKLG